MVTVCSTVLNGYSLFNRNTGPYGVELLFSCVNDVFSHKSMSLDKIRVSERS